MNLSLREALALTQDMRRENGFRPSYSAVWSQLLHWENSRTGSTCPAQSVVARALGYCRETVNRACAWLEAHGYIKSQQRIRRIMRNAVRFLSKRYWIAKERDQVAFLLAQYQATTKKLYARLQSGPARQEFSSDRKITPPSTSELNPDEIRALKEKFQLRWKV